MDEYRKARFKEILPATIFEEKKPMTVREFLDLFTGIPLEAKVVGYDDDPVTGVSFDIKEQCVTIHTEFAFVTEYDDEDYFTDEDRGG